MNNDILDKWDFMVLDYIKRSNCPTIEGVKKIWAERCMIKDDDVAAVFIFHHFFEVFHKLQLHCSKPYLYREFINNCAPNKFFLLRHWLGDNKPFEMSDMFLDNLTITNKLYWEMMLASLLSQFMFLTIDDLPGYREHIKN